MTKDSEIRKMKVLGEEWTIEIDYLNGDIWGIGIWNEESQEYMIKVSDPYELQVIGKNLVAIGKELDKISDNDNE